MIKHCKQLSLTILVSAPITEAVMQRTLNLMRLEKEPSEALIAPELKEFRLLDFLKRQNCATAGAKAARDFLESLSEQSRP